MIFAGIDPGARGGFALVRLAGLPEILEAGLLPSDPAQVAALAARMRDAGVEVCALERAQPRPGQNVKSTFAQAANWAAVRAVLVAGRVPLMEPAPAAWKRWAGLSSSKVTSRAVASVRIPGGRDWWPRANDEGIAEAALLALYAAAQSGARL